DGQPTLCAYLNFAPMSSPGYFFTEMGWELAAMVSSKKNNQPVRIDYPPSAIGLGGAVCSLTSHAEMNFVLT
ncbi:MAG TPA: hypothetical protein VEG30_15620, partial [Terriglobales bacterium]|nr:hypothetical protein [Terriglobales bacterium]